QKTPGGYSFDSETRHPPLISRHCTKPFLFKPLRTLLQPCEDQPFSFPSLTHSLPKTTRGGGYSSILTSLPPCVLYLAVATSLQSPVINRCIIPPREHPTERTRMPSPRLPHRKGNHYSRILSTFPERPRQRLQPEVEPRSAHESRRSRRPPGPAFPGRPIPGPLRQRLGQPRHQIRTSSPGSLQLLSSRNCHSLRFIAPRPANSRRAPHPRRTHARFRQ